MKSGNVFEEMPVSSAGELTRGHIKIQEGCNNFAAIASFRTYAGACAHAAPTAFVEARALAARSVREIVLTGIHISSYGQDNGESLLNVLSDLNEIKGISRIRLGSLEPHILTRIFAGAKEYGKGVPAFPCIASKRQRRHSDENEPEIYFRAILEYIANIREAYDKPAVTTDIIAGFPGETEGEFAETCTFVKECRFFRIHVFPYSEREGTPAASMECRCQ